LGATGGVIVWILGFNLNGSLVARNDVKLAVDPENLRRRSNQIMQSGRQFGCGTQLCGEAKMDLVGIIIFLLIGAIAGWLAGQIMKGGSYGLLGDIIVGIVGAAIASFLLPRLGIVIGGGVLGAIINATIGACILLFVLRLVRR
jgi:uncharacterized membrane protein YeaQ/YmgE (transglycosylase-associated protein family)